jgi:hypothetical protein
LVADVIQMPFLAHLAAFLGKWWAALALERADRAWARSV